MPSYLDFDSTKRFRDYILGKTLNQQNGPQTFSKDTYSVQTLSEMSNVDLPAVDFNRSSDLLQTQNSNTFKPLEYFVTDTLETLPRRANLQLYPYFVSGNHNLISVMSTNNYDTESELFKFAAFNIKNNPQGPVFARIQRNLEAATTGRLRILDALNGNTATAANIIRGKEPLVESNNSITVAKTLPGKAIDFLQTVSGVEFPWSEIPGDYLSDPRNPVNYRPAATTQLGKVWQDVTGALGSLIGIQRRPKLDRKPSDLMIEYMGEGQKYRLYDALSYSKYAPNYTTTARSQNSSKIFGFVDKVAQGVKNILGAEAPAGTTYIGDDRGNDVKYAMGDFNDRQVRSGYYLGLMFDPVQAELFQRSKNISQGGSISGNLTWISKNSKNKLGTHNKEWDSEQSVFADTRSTNHTFREDSILGHTQEILDTLPMDGGASRSHVANVIDQTSRVFRDGDVMMSRGSAVKYVKTNTGEESGIEYCRVWTKDRSYMNYSDTMKRTGGIRKYDKDSVVSNPWNLNIGPMSNGKKDFSSSTNIFPNKENNKVYGGEGFYAKKYMFSIENLAWKTSNTPGYDVQSLPYCERGSNGGRVMWFPPYDLKVSEQNSAKWEENSFLGRPEPIYTYQNTSRSGQISFKVVVDHPSILNLLVREHFNGMSDEDADEYINAFFAGCEEIDFYDLIKRYSSITPEDGKLIKDYLEKKTDPETIKKFRTETEPIVTEKPKVEPVKNEGVKLSTSLLFANDRPSGGSSEYMSVAKYRTLYDQSLGQNNGLYIVNALKELEDSLNVILPLALNGGNTTPAVNARKDIKTLFGKEIIPLDQHAAVIQQQKDSLVKQINKGASNYSQYKSKMVTLKEDIKKGDVQEITITAISSCSAVADNSYNYKLSIRRSHSIFKDIISELGGDESKATWIETPKGSPTEVTKLTRKISFKDLGFEGKEGNLIFIATNMGENVPNEEHISCSDKGSGFNNKALKVNAPIAFGCRQSKVEFNYTKAVKQQDPQKPNDEVTPPRTKLVSVDEPTSPTRSKKPAINPMKRIIMKTLSECYYFKTLEEKDPVVFGSLKEKLKYFHPGFHSTTPEGLNSRLTFIQQCIRPGDTIPIKGISDALDMDARNTTFGPPPICVLRIGDFYHSKIIIRDVNITFDDTTWDMNPEGIGMQPMIANVSLQINFIGGQGMSKPVERLQNALSSNFYANTEMYDERSESTGSISGMTTADFTKSFLEDLQKLHPETADSNMANDGKKYDDNKYIGSPSGNILSYGSVIGDIYSGTTEYFTSYETSYNELNKEYGPLLMKLIFGPDYRSIKTYDIFETTSTTPSSSMDLVGVYDYTKTFSRYVMLFKLRMTNALKNENLSTIFGFEKDLTEPKIVKANELLYPHLKKLIETKVDSLIENKKIKGFEKIRNKLIERFDKVNFLVEYGHDMIVQEENSKKVVLSGYTYNLIYDEYKPCIDYIKDNTSKMYDSIDNTIDFDNPTFTTSTLGLIISSFLSSDPTNRTNLMDVFKSDTLIFDTNTMEKLQKRLDKFIETPKEVKFKFKTLKDRKSDKEISFTIAEIVDSTSYQMSTDAKNMFAKQELARNKKLNHYRNNNE